jgi:hypothetical protein
MSSFLEKTKFKTHIPHVYTYINKEREGRERGGRGREIKKGTHR